MHPRSVFHLRTHHTKGPANHQGRLALQEGKEEPVLFKKLTIKKSFNSHFTENPETSKMMGVAGKSENFDHHFFCIKF
jgi:hypothetical protein